VHEATFHRLPISLVEGVGPQIAVDRSLCEQVVDDDQDGMGDSDSRLRPAAAGGQSSVLRRQIGALGPSSSVCGLDQAGPQPGASLAGPAAAAVSGALVGIARPEAAPLLERLIQLQEAVALAVVTHGARQRHAAAAEMRAAINCVGV
jgi:hypothetical protein